MAVLAGALRGRMITSDVRFSDDPFGVAYLVASIRVRSSLKRQEEQKGERHARSGGR